MNSINAKNNIDVMVGAREVIAYSAVNMLEKWTHDMLSVAEIDPEYIDKIGGDERSDVALGMLGEIHDRSLQLSHTRQEKGIDMTHDPMCLARVLMKLAAVSYATADRSMVEIVSGFVYMFDTVFTPDIDLGWKGYKDSDTQICREIMGVARNILHEARGLDLVEDWMEGLDEDGSLSLQLLEAMGMFEDRAEA